MAYYSEDDAYSGAYWSLCRAGDYSDVVEHAERLDLSVADYVACFSDHFPLPLDLNVEERLFTLKAAAAWGVTYDTAARLIFYVANTVVARLRASGLNDLEVSQHLDEFRRACERIPEAN